MVKTAGNSDSLIPTATAPVLDSTDLQAAVLEEDQERGPLIEGVVDRSAHEAFGQ
ncbi:hypothetical protein EV701_13169, partial [Chthoniobacter flavus]